MQEINAAYKIDLNEITITKLSKIIKNKTFSIKEIVSQYLEQIDSFDKGFNGLNSILENVEQHIVFWKNGKLIMPDSYQKTAQC